jgi:homoserine O-acetyltransferase/O-succinyltransferase
LINHIFNYPYNFTLESGIKLPRYHLAYSTAGTLNAAGNNVVWVFHALTANSNPLEWWPGLIGNGKLFDPEKYFIVCVNMPGSCYGSIGPLSENAGGEIFYHHFPLFTTRDMVRAYQPLKNYLGITSIQVGIGGSMGGQQLLEWAIIEPALFTNIILLATNAKHSPWGIAFNASQRLCIEADESWLQKNNNAGINGMMVARSVALISYRHYDGYQLAQGENDNEKTGNFKSESYQRYQGQKLAKRFNAFSYYFLSKAMDAHNVGRGRQSVENALQQITANTLVIGIETDILFPLVEQQFLATHIPGAIFKAINSLFGHDGFLLEYEQIEKHIIQFLQNKR